MLAPCAVASTAIRLSVRSCVLMHAGVQVGVGWQPTGGVPAVLLDRPNWVRHDAAKVPLIADGQGRRAMVDRTGTWRPYRVARAGSVGVGLGFVLDGSGVVCVDLDHVLIDGALVPWCADLLASCPATWVEVSPSGEGLHVWGLGTVGQGRRVSVDGGGVEVYDRGRYITVTGKRFDEAPTTMADLTGWIELLPTS